MDWQIVGHKNQLELLEKAMRNGKLAHAYVFAGPEGVGKRTVAKRMAQEMLFDLSSTPPLVPPHQGEGNPSPKFFHPDFLEINGEGGIKIEQIRELTYKLSLLPYQAKYKVALIDHADQMTTEAANALLKVLEEPKSYTYIFLITSNPNRLLKTVLSRAQKITFGPAFAEASSSAKATSDKSAGKLIDKPEENTEETQTLNSFYEIFLTAKLSDRLINAYDIADLETNEIKKLFDYWLKKLQQSLHIQASKPLANKISQVMLARKYLEQNVNTKLLLTNLMLNTA